MHSKTSVDVTDFRNEDPRSILVVPVINNSVDVTASDLFLSTITVPIAEKGYYVFPVNLVKRVLEDEGLSDAVLVHKSSAKRLNNLFGADAVLYVTIEKWEALYAILSSEVNVAFSYEIRSGKTDEILWTGSSRMSYKPSNTAGNPVAYLIVSAINAAVTKAKPPYEHLTKLANIQALKYPGFGIPAGPYSEVYKKDDDPEYKVEVDNYRTTRKQILNAFKKKDYDKTIKLATKQLENFKYDTESYINRADALSQIGKYNQAINDYDKAMITIKERAISGKDSLMLAQSGKSLCLAEIGEYNAALELIDICINQSEIKSTFYSKRSYILNKQGDYDNAIEYAFKSLDLEKNNPYAHINIGLAYYGKGKYAQSVDSFNKSIELDKTYDVAYIKRGEAYKKLGKNENYIADYKLACEYGNIDACSKLKN